jgi:hypothetical protein
MSEIVKPRILENPIGETQVEIYCCRFKENKEERTAF